MVFQTIKLIMRFVILTVFIISFPLLYLIVLTQSNSFKEAFEESVDVIKSVLKEFQI